MSYILDALRKADAERERGSVPGLHTQQTHVLADDAAAPPRGAWVKLVMAGLFAVLLATLAWLLLERTGSPSLPAAAPPPQAAASPALPEPPPAGTLPVAPVSVAAPPSTAQAVPPATPAADAAPAPPPAVPAAPTTRPSDSFVPPTTAPSAAKTSPATKAGGTPRRTGSAAPADTAPATPRTPAPRLAPWAEPPPSVAKAATTTSQRGTTPPAGRPGEAKPEPDPATAAGPIYQLKDLPEGIRRELPALSVGGSAYSKSPADRLLIVHGQVFHEGAALAPGLRLEEIRHKSAVLSYKGYRYEITF